MVLRIDNKAIETRLNSVIAARTFEDKRRNIEQFDVRAQIRKDGKILLSCYLMAEPEILDLDAPQSYIAFAGITVGETVKGTTQPLLEAMYGLAQRTVKQRY